MLRLVVLLVAICAFATVDAIVKGHHGGTRNSIGNISAPWALLPFLAGALVMQRRRSVGALVGALSTVAALVCYTLIRVGVFGMGGRNRDFSATVASAAGNRWFLLGAIGGAVLGAAGAALATRGQWGVVTAVVTCLLVLEPAARVFWAIARDEPARTMVPSPVVWGTEMICGCLALVGFQLRRTWRR
ncbi:MAG TPA: DUF6518 family protein [Acidimicrobiales bacterium]|nr:DUF6518 family protein [Acidimicrobiales bacterium]